MADLPPNRNLLAAGALLDELHRGGMLDVCVSPGSRSAPLTLAADRSPLRIHLHVDERCAAFYALGLAKATRRPVGLICSSGSAAANYHPAIMEACEAGVPLVVLGANRPPRLVDSGANQTSEQARLFGPHVLRFEAVEPPRVEGRWLRWLRGRAGRMLEIALRGPGPVHFDLAFEEPLSPAARPEDGIAQLAATDPVAVFGRPDGRPFTDVAGGEPTAPGAAERLRVLAEGGRGVVVVGPLDADRRDAAGIAAIARALGAPLLADPLSGVRGAGGALGAYDLFLRSAAVREHLRPHWLLCIGRPPTSKTLLQWMATIPERVVVDPGGRRDDPEARGGTWLRAPVRELARALAAGRAQEPPGDGGGVPWIELWRGLEGATRVAADRALDAAPADFEGRMVRALAQTLPGKTVLWTASSMPVREIDAFWPAGVAGPRLLANRGVSGIDGLVSSALGAAAAGRPTVAVLGDLATLHDVGGLAAVRRLGAAACFVVWNNGGGGIFEYLPLTETDAPVERLFVTPHAQRFDGLAAAFGLQYRAVGGDGLAAEVAGCLGGPATLIEVSIDRQRSREARLALRAAVAEAAARHLGLAPGDPGGEGS